MQRLLLSGDSAVEKKRPRLFLREGAGKVDRASCTWQELNGACRGSIQQGKGQGCQERVSPEQVPAAGQSVLAGKWPKAILSLCAFRTAVQSKAEQLLRLSAHLPSEGLCQQQAVVLYMCPRFSLCYRHTVPARRVRSITRSTETKAGRERC